MVPSRKNVEQRVEYTSLHSDNRDGYTPYRLICKEEHDNLHPGLIKLEEWMFNKG